MLQVQFGIAGASMHVSSGARRALWCALSVSIGTSAVCTVGIRMHLDVLHLPMKCLAIYIVSTDSVVKGQIVRCTPYCAWPVNNALLPTSLMHGTCQSTVASSIAIT